MNKIEIPAGYIFEFFDEANLADDILCDIEDKNIDWVTSKTGQQGLEIFTNLVYPKNGNYVNTKVFSWLETCLEEVRNCYFTSGKLSITDAWVHKSDFGEKSSSHWHSMSMFSGLFYLTDHTNTVTYFEIPDDFHTRYDSIFAPILKKDQIKISSNPEKGRLLIWPSYIKHYVDKHRYKDSRYTLAFNTFLEGDLYDVPGARLNIKLSNHNS